MVALLEDETSALQDLHEQTEQQLQSIVGEVSSVNRSLVEVTNKTELGKIIMQNPKL